MHVANARLKSRGLSAARVGASCALAFCCFLLGSNALQNAIAEGDTRTISMHHVHTGEDITITFKRDGRYDEAALDKLNWLLRDWRRGEATRMDPHLIDLVWEVQREVGTKEPIFVVCGYRSPQTNAMLRRRSSGVARFSQHMLGHAMDFYIPGVPLAELRAIGLRLQRGGVGFYPQSGSPFVHMDTGGIRMWPRMSREELVRVFPDGRTVHIPSDGRPLPGYALALADISKRGGSLPSARSIEAARSAGIDVENALASNATPSANPFAKLFSVAKDDDDEDDAPSVSAAAPPAVAATPAVPRHTVLAALEHGAKVAETAGKATASAAIKVAAAASKVKLIRPAEAAPSRVAEPRIATAGPATPNEIIVARGYWRAPAEATPATRSLLAAARQRPDASRPADGEATGSIGPFADPRFDQSAGTMTLAYTEPAGHDAAAALRAAALSAQRATRPAVATTMAVKRGVDQAALPTLTAGATLLTVVKSNDAHFADPWLRAVVMSPSVHRYLTTAALGVRDFRWLAAQMVKPSSAVLMTFAGDPNPGLDADHFNGAAIVFVSTVSYPMRTAALR